MPECSSGHPRKPIDSCVAFTTTLAYACKQHAAIAVLKRRYPVLVGAEPDHVCEAGVGTQPLFDSIGIPAFINLTLEKLIAAFSHIEEQDLSGDRIQQLQHLLRRHIASIHDVVMQQAEAGHYVELGSTPSQLPKKSQTVAAGHLAFRVPVDTLANLDCSWIAINTCGTESCLCHLSDEPSITTADVKVAGRQRRWPPGSEKSNHLREPVRAVPHDWP